MDDMLQEFLTETGESLAELDNDLVRLEQTPDDKNLLSKIFRVMHTIKGTSGFLSLPRLGAVAHKAEDLLGLFREEALPVTPAAVSLVLEALDRIKEILAAIPGAGHEPAGDDAYLIARLAAACSGDHSPSSAACGGDPSPSSAQDAPPAFATRETAAAGTVPSTEASLSPEAAPPAAAHTLRVSVDVLENLMTLVSELVLTRNQILQVARAQSGRDSSMNSSLQRLSHIVSDLQDGVMKTRMQPVGTAWAKLPRLVRDTAGELGKKIELEMLGQETELDRQVLDMIKDPLTHMVRNSADHGIETPAERRALGKPETGRIRLNSYHEGGHIVIEISDDGRGLALDKIRHKILQSRLASEADIAAMDVRQLQQYIFHAGFSTAEAITAVSGRGVGMDVVRANIEKIGGAIEMTSAEGRGTTFTIKIPLTLAIVSSLIVGVDDERFAIPQLDVTELVMLTPGGAHHIETINGAPVFRLRERILPLIPLSSLLGLRDRSHNGLRYIAVINAAGRSFGIIVDQVFDTEEIVVKPLGSLMAGQAVFSGNTILGDGQVIMILDSAGILRASGIAEAAAAQARARPEEAAAHADETTLLLFETGGRKLRAVPLQHVARLEEIDLAQLELAGGQRVVQYGDTLMPIHLADPAAPLPAQGKRPVIVFKSREGQAGLLVERILDITAHRGPYQMRAGGKGEIEGSAILRGQVTDILDLSYERGNA